MKFPKRIFHKSDGTMFCAACDIPVTSSQKSSCEKHLKSALYKPKIEAAESPLGKKTEVQKS